MKVCDFPHERIEIACDKCGRKGSYKKTSFLPDADLPDILNAVTKNCPRNNPLEMLDRCRAYYPQLASR